MLRPASESSSSVLAAAITAGGQSRRFGQDKALYELDGVPLLNRVADSLQHASPRLLVAPAGRYRLDGWQTVPDLRPGQGPLAGLETALTALLDQQPATIAQLYREGSERLALHELAQSGMKFVFGHDAPPSKKAFEDGHFLLNHEFIGA